MESLRPPAELNLTENAANNWKVFKQKFEIFLEATDKTKAAEARKIAIFLNCIGDGALDVYNNFNFPEGEALTLKKVVEEFDSYVKPRTNVVIERHKFFTRTQQPSEPFDHFLTELQKLAKNCNFGDQEESLMRDRIIISISDDALQQRLLRDSDLNLKKTIECCRAAELSKMQQKTLKQSGQADVNSVDAIKKSGRKNHKFKAAAKQQQPQQQQQQQQQKGDFGQQDYDCKKCGTRHKARSCPAYGKSCNKCGKLNHFSVGCQVKKADKNVSELQAFHVSDFFYVDAISSVSSKPWTHPVTICDMIIDFKLDTGADCNVIPLKVFKTLNCNSTVENSRIILESYFNETRRALGFITLDCLVNGKMHKIQFILAVTKSMPVLGRDTCKLLDLVRRVNSEVNAVNTHTCADLSRIDSKENFILKNKDVFEGIGAYPKEYEIVLKENAQPVVNSGRRVPLAIKDKLKFTLTKLEQSDIIEKVDYVTDWVHNIVIVEKADKSLRICLDPLYLNECLKEEKFLIPTADELSAKLSGKKVFTVLDMKDGFHQVKLTDKSSDLCTFITPFGKYRYKRLPFGLSTAPEVFQRMNVNIFCDIEGVESYFDDLIISAETEAEHDVILDKVIDRARKNGVRFNVKKLQYKVNSVKYIGLIFNENGVSPDPDQVESLLEMRAPENKAELVKLLGMFNYLSKFIQNAAELMSPLRDLTKSKVPWNWTPDHDKCLDNLKKELCKVPTLKLFDSNLPIEIQTDASQNGLGACLMQLGRPVSFVSRKLTDTEKRYSQIEKELLAVCFALQKFHLFVYGNKVKVYTDHKPLISVIKKDIHKVSARLQRLKLKLLKYKIDLNYLPGTKMLIADLLSRLYLNNDVREDETHAEMVHGLDSEVAMSQKRVKEFRQATEEDPSLKIVLKHVKEGWPENKDNLRKEAKIFWPIRDEITEMDGLLFHNNKIIVPELLQREMIALAHKPHFGIEKTTNRLRQIFYWSSLSSDVVDFIAHCETCQKFSRSNTKEPLIPHEIPPLPFEKIGIDIFQYKGKDFLALVDYYSKWLEIVPLVNKTAKEVKERLKVIFSTHGIPQKVVCDNMPFSSYEFKEFARQWSFEIVNSSPIYPKSNGMAEKAVGIAKALLKKSEEEKTSIAEAMLEYRNLPISGMNVSPSQLLMSRKTRTLLPIVKSQLKPEVCNVEKLLKLRQEKQKVFYDRSAKSRECFQRGQNVRYQNKGIWEPATITKVDKNPRSYTIVNQKGNEIRRNSIHLKKAFKNPVINRQNDADSVRYDDLVEKTNCEDLIDVEPPSESESFDSSDSGTLVGDNVANLLDVSDSVEEPPAPNVNVIQSEDNVKTTRSGRPVTLPVRLRDYDLS